MARKGTFTRIESALIRLADERDALAQQIKATLNQAQFGNEPLLAPTPSYLGA